MALTLSHFEEVFGVIRIVNNACTPAYGDGPVT
jgi:hypothetical protein